MRYNEIISELRGIKGDVAHLEPDAGHDSWEKLLAQHGFKAIGQGANAQVYSNIKLPYVLKVFTNADTAYQQWVKYCKGPLLGNPYVPVFRGGIVRLTPDAMATRMETLEPTSPDQQILTRQMQWIIRDSISKNRSLSSYPHVNDMDDSLYEAMTYIHAAVKNDKHMLDLHGGNVMQRPDGQMVIIDPLA